MNGKPSSLLYAIAVTLAAFFVAWLLGSFGPVQIDGIQSDDATDAAAQAQREYRRDMVAARMCREQHGPSLVRWTVDGQAVCVPVQVSSNP